MFFVVAVTQYLYLIWFDMVDFDFRVWFYIEEKSQ